MNPSSFSSIPKLNYILRQSKRLLKSLAISSIVLLRSYSAFSYFSLIVSHRENSLKTNAIPKAKITIYSQTMYQKLSKRSALAMGMKSKRVIVVIIEPLGSMVPLSRHSDCLSSQMQKQRFMCYISFFSDSSSMQRLASAIFYASKPSLLFCFLYIFILSVIEIQYYSDQQPMQKLQKELSNLFKVQMICQGVLNNNIGV